MNDPQRYTSVAAGVCAHLSSPPSRVCGSLGYYDVTKEKKISLKSPLHLQECDCVFHKVSTTDDPIIREVSGLEEREEGEEAEASYT